MLGEAARPEAGRITAVDALVDPERLAQLELDLSRTG